MRYTNKRIEVIYKRLPDKIVKIKPTVLYDSHDVIILISEILSSSPKIIDSQIVLAQGFVALYFEFCKKFYDIAMIFNKQKVFTGYYCNINTPIRRFKGGYEVTDLCLDIWVFPDKHRFIVLDEEEFNIAINKGWISKCVEKEARAALYEIIKMIKTKVFPHKIVSAKWLWQGRMYDTARS